MPETEILVLAGGFGTRLRSAVSDVPKALAPVAGRPFIQYLIENWIRQGAARLTFLLHHQAAQIETFLAEGREGGSWDACDIRTLTEPQPLGTGGSVAYAVRQLKLNTPVLVTNADTWLGTGIREIASSNEPCIAIVEVANTERYGRVQVEGQQISAFDEKQASHGGGWINAGLYKLHPDQFADWNGQPFSLERELFTDLVTKGQLNAVPLNTDFIDIGVPEDYFRFCHRIESAPEGTLCS